MSDSIVDLGAAGEYISEKFDDVVDYFTGTPKARAGSRGFFKDLGPGVRQYYLGPGEKEGESFFEYLGFEDGGVAIPQEDMDEFVDFIQRNRPSYKEGETTTYKDFGGMLGMQPPVNQPPPKNPIQEGRGIGIGSFDLYKGFADPYFPQRPIQKQDFSGIRGFQMGTKIKLNDRDDAVGTKLMRQAGMQASANQVMDNLDPKVLAQMSRILGRNIG